MKINRQLCSLLLVSLPILVHCGGSSDANLGEGAGASAGAAGEAGSSGAAGSAGAASGPVFPIDPAAAARAAVLLGSCIPDDGPARMLQAFYVKTEPADTPDLVDAIQCLAGKTNGCAGVAECTGVLLTADSASCGKGCDGNTAFQCSDGFKFTADCTKLGATCFAADCKVLKPKSCDSTYEEACVDGSPHSCWAGDERIGPKCTELGLACEKTLLGVTCVGTGAACQSDSMSMLTISFDEGMSCDGAKLHACLNGKEAVRDCGEVGKGFICQTMGTSFFCGQGAACDPTDKPASSCNGDSVSLCNAGQVEEVDCKALGFTGCLASRGVCIPSPWQP